MWVMHTNKSLESSSTHRANQCSDFWFVSENLWETMQTNLKGYFDDISQMPRYFQKDSFPHYVLVFFLIWLVVLLFKH